MSKKNSCHLLKQSPESANKLLPSLPTQTGNHQTLVGASHDNQGIVIPFLPVPFVIGA